GIENASVYWPASRHGRGPSGCRRSPDAAMTRARTLLEQQVGRCFYCGDVLAPDKASVEHIWPTGRGGPNTTENKVACCVAVNRAMANKPIKAKLAVAMQPSFQCPDSDRLHSQRALCDDLVGQWAQMRSRKPRTVQALEK